MKITLKILVIIVFLTFTAYKVYEYKFYIDFVPDELGVYNILYTKSEVWGLGPGGWDTSLYIYELPEEAARNIEKQGINYFKLLPSNVQKGSDWQGYYPQWNETPVRVEQEVLDRMSEGDKAIYSNKVPEIYPKPGPETPYSIQVDPQIEKLTDDSSSQAGNFYAYGRIGIIIVNPKLRRVIFAHSG